MDSQRRQHLRTDVRLAAELDRGDRRPFTAVTRNVSVGGAALESAHPIHDGELFKLSLFLVEQDIEDETMPPLVLGARVVWAAEGDHGRFTAGVRFEKISAAQTEWLAKFLEAVAHEAE